MLVDVLFCFKFYICYCTLSVHLNVGENITV